jgi:hypothetical protein
MVLLASMESLLKLCWSHPMYNEHPCRHLFFFFQYFHFFTTMISSMAIDFGLLEGMIKARYFRGHFQVIRVLIFSLFFVWCLWNGMIMVFKVSWGGDWIKCWNFNKSKKSIFIYIFESKRNIILCSHSFIFY